MAHVKQIWFHDSTFKRGDMRVIIALHPSGEVLINVPLPEDIRAVILKLAQTAANAHEAQMHAEILGERYVRIDVSKANKKATEGPKASMAHFYQAGTESRGDE